MLTYILIIGGVLAVFLLIIGAVISTRSEKKFIEERLGKYLVEEAPKVVKEKHSPLGDWVNVLLERSAWGNRIARDLARADLKLKPAEYVSLMVIAGIGVGVLSWFFGGRSIIFTLVGVGFGVTLPRMYVRREQSRRLLRFSDQLPDMLNIMVNGLRAGYSSMQAMESVSKELPSPICDEFHRLIQEVQLGIPMERALDNLLRRIPSDDLDLTITAINVQREVGGNLAEILDTISHTIRERVRIKGEVRVLTTQMKYSGRFLSMFPIFIALALWFMNRPYIMMFVAEDTRMIGIPMIILGVLMVSAGYFVMNKLGDIEV